MFAHAFKYGLLLASAALTTACSATCPDPFTREGDRCVDPNARDSGAADAASSDAALHDATTDAQADAGPDPCTACLTSELCFENECLAFDNCGRAFGVPCDTFGPHIIKGGDTEESDNMGWSVSFSGDGQRFAVGAQREHGGDPDDERDNTMPEAGAVYVFVRSAGSWIQEAYLKASNLEAGDRVGIAVSLDADGDTLAVGAHHEDGLPGTGAQNNDASNAGAAYVFHRVGTTWTEASFLKPDTGESDDFFGQELALSGNGNYLVVSAPEGDAGDVHDSGVAFLFERRDTGWVQTQRFEASNATTDDNFGSDVAINDEGSLLAIGASLEDNPDTGQSQNGAVHIFGRSGSTWSEEDVLRGNDPTMYFGSSVAMNGTGLRLAVGAPGSDGAVVDQGTVQAFERVQGAWQTLTGVAAANPNNGSQFGASVALNGPGTVLVVGARLENSGGVRLQSNPSGTGSALNSGALYVYTQEGTSWPQTAFVKAPNTGPQDQFGREVTVDDAGRWLLTGAPFEDEDASGGHASNAGAAYLMRIAQ